MPASKLVLAFVGMPGAGKSEASLYLAQKNIPFVRFGQLTDEGLKEMGLSINPQNERMYREKIRTELGMAAYAIKAKPKIDQLLKEHDVVALDGLYSWEEYTFLKEEFPNLILVHIFAEPTKRYKRLSERKVRPVPTDECRPRDIAEIENLNKGGPIAMADYIIENNSDDMNNLYSAIDALLVRLGVGNSDDSHKN